MEITRNDAIRGAVGLVTGGPLGLFLSPAIGRLFNGRWTPWALSGIVLGPLGWGIATVPIALLTYKPSTAPTALPQLATAANPPTTPSMPPDAPSAGFPAIPQPTAEPASQPASQPAQTQQDAPLNTYVSDNLNSADRMFSSNMDGCTNVSVAISAANNPSIYGPIGPAQRAELKRYADRCGLRF